jgi:hypothetical protein
MKGIQKMNHGSSVVRDLSAVEIGQVGGGVAFVPIFWAGMQFGGTAAGFAIAAHQLGTWLVEVAEETVQETVLDMYTP